MTGSYNQDPVEQLAAQCPARRSQIEFARGRFDDLDGVGFEHRVENPSVFRIPVPDQELQLLANWLTGH